MEDKKFLKVMGKVIDLNGKSIEACAVVPYKRGGSAVLPDIPPFNSNIVLHGDDGFNMRYIEYTLNGKILYFYNSYYEFENDKIHAEARYWGKEYIFDFELIEEQGE